MTAKIHLMALTQFAALVSQRPSVDDFLSTSQHRCRCEFVQPDPYRPANFRDSLSQLMCFVTVFCEKPHMIMIAAL